jgi:NAD(P)-dependent dehydrogenase (short-subunit alcohol dehydrogenase family)
MGVIIVTGGSRGIGADICRLAAQRGYGVCVNYLLRRERSQRGRQGHRGE